MTETTTLSPDHTPAVRAETARDKALNSVFTTALEGGIGYWSTCSRYRWTVDGTLDGQAADFIAVIHDTEDEDEDPDFVIDRGVILKGIREACKHGGWNGYHSRALNALHFGKWDEADYDADTADLIVQFGLFGRQVYAG